MGDSADSLDRPTDESARQTAATVRSVSRLEEAN
jgi:hypothetical protein